MIKPSTSGNLKNEGRYFPAIGVSDLADETQFIRRHADIVKIIGRYVILSKFGKEFTGLCPFHQEKTPSFTVSPTKQMYYCFGCSAGGDVFRFLQRAETLSFPQAKAIAAELSGLPAAVTLTPEMRRSYQRHAVAVERRGRRARAEFKAQRARRDAALDQYFGSLRFLLHHDPEECQRRGDLRYEYAVICFEESEVEYREAQARMDVLKPVAQLAKPDPDEHAVAVTVEVIRLLEIAQQREAA